MEAFDFTGPFLQALLHATAQQTPSGHLFVGHHQPSTPSAGEPHGPQSLHPKNERAGRGKGEEEKAPQIPLLSRYLWQRASPLHESTLKACSPVPRVMAHAAYLQSDYSNATSFWLISLGVGFFPFPSPPLFFLRYIR